MDASFGRNHPALTALLVAVPLIALVVFVGSRTGDEAGHATSHLAVGLPALLLLFSLPRWRERAPGWPGAVGRRLLVIGLALIGGGQVLEAVAAFGFEGYARQHEWLAKLHDLSMFAAPPGLLLLIIGGVFTVVARMNQRAEGSGRIALVVISAAALAALLVKFAVLGA